MSNKDRQPAFPNRVTFTTGMDLRDYFAAKALQSLIEEPAWSGGQNPLVASVMGRYKSENEEIEEFFSVASYKIADAMMEARKK